MQKYPVRPSHRKNLDPPTLAIIARSHFEGSATEASAVTAHWGAIERLVARAEGRDLAIELTMNPKVPESVAAETIARYNRFLEETTGFGAKERARRLRKAAKGPAGD